MNPSARKLILASRSPRRQELLAAADYQFEVRPPSEGAETPAMPGETPEALVARLARQKAADVLLGADDAIVIGCDTVAECDGAVLGKPRDRDDARQMLRAVCGREHRVLSGLCLWAVGSAEPLTEVAVTRLRMDPLRDEQIEDYLDGGAWQGKAGAFGYQDRTGWVHVIQGSVSNVVGLPLELLATMLARIAN